MSIYFDSKITIPDSTTYGLGKRIFLEVDWHKQHPLLAIAHSDDKQGATVSVYDHVKGETINTESSPQPGVQITALNWHPTSRILTIGYETGEVLIWNHDDSEIFEGSRGHAAAVMLMEWSNDGTLLVTSDNMGILIIWKSDPQGHLQTQSIHDFKDPVCQIVFRQKIHMPQKKNDDTERALVKMTSWRPKTGRNRNEAGTSRRDSRLEDSGEKPEGISFFAGVLSGTIYYLKENGSSDEILSSGSTIRSLLYYQAKDILIVMTEAQIMGQFYVDTSGDLKEINKMKLSGNGEMRLYWVGTSTLAVVGKDPFVRLWDVESGSNTVIEPPPNEVTEDESFLSIEYHPKDGILCCCTSKGKLVMWKEMEPAFSDDGECRQTDDTHWEAVGVTPVPTSSKSAKWCKNVSGLIAVNSIQDIIILREQELCFYYGHKVSIVQVQPNQLSFNMIAHRKTFEVKVDMQIRGLTASGTHVVIWNGVKLVTYEFGPQLPSNYKYIGSFASKTDTILIQEQSLYLQEIGQIQIRTFQGTIKQTLAFTGNEGPPITMAIGGDYFTTGTENSFLKIWHIGRREAKLHTSPKNLNEFIENIGEIISANTNFSGTKVCFAVAKTNLVPDSRFFVMDLTTFKIQDILFPNRFVEKFFWELEDPSFIAVEVRLLSKELMSDSSTSIEDSIQSVQIIRKVEPSLKSLTNKSPNRSANNSIRRDSYSRRQSKESIGKMEEDNNEEQKIVERPTPVVDLPLEIDHAVVTMFADMEKGFLVHEKRTEMVGKTLVGLEVPYVYLAENGAWKNRKPMLKDTKSVKRSLNTPISSNLKVRIDAQLIQEFDGIEDEEKEGKAALLKYVYHTLFNDMDGALKAIWSIKNIKIYTNMVRNCVKTKRMDVALHCLAKMREPRIAREVRLVMESEPELDSHVATLAVQLGMMDEAQELFRACKRYDLLLEFYINAQWWDKAVELCENHRRIQLRSTYQAYAKSLEGDKRIDKAIEMYEKAETHRYEVPRMLVDDPDKLQDYVVKKKDKELYQWWAQYLESSGEVESALRYYELAHDWLSLVRLLCFLGNYEKAVHMAEKAEDKASAYHLARTLEDKGEVNKAISFYSRAGAYGHAIRMCQVNNMFDDLWRMAMKAEPSEMVEAAKYFETMDPPYNDRAVQLYHKAGYDSKALDLAFSTQEFEALQTVVRDIMAQPNLNTDPLLLQRCAEFFVKNDEIDKALDMLCAAHKYPEAMDLCVLHNFTITDEIAERLTAPKGHGLDEQTRIRLLEKMGESCTVQGSYHLAAKKFTQAGNKVQAMKSLLKSGDTDRIIFYANHSRHREIYMMGANYLQTTDWRKDTKIIQTIVQYYTKAQAYESLAGFYENIAESEIEDSRNYKTALEEYYKAEKSLQDLVACGARQYEDQLTTIQAKISFITRFLSVKAKLLKSDGDSAMADLKKLIEDPKSEVGVRTGDIYGLIVEHYVNQGELRQALTVLEEMRKYIPNKNLNKFLSPETISKMEKGITNESLFRVKSGESNKKQSSTTLATSPAHSSSGGNLLSFLNTNQKNGNVAEEDEEGLIDDDDDDEEGIEDEEEIEEEIEDEEELIEEEETEEDESPNQTSQQYKTQGGFFSKAYK